METVIKPLYIDYKVVEDDGSFFLEIARRKDRYIFKSHGEPYRPTLYYNAGDMWRVWKHGVAYQFSCVPQYADGELLRYTLIELSGDSTAPDLEAVLYPMQLFLTERLPIYHSGWLFVAGALLFDKRPVRDLASEYIAMYLEAGADLHYLATAIGVMLAGRMAPINRFVEYLDRLGTPPVKAFKRATIEAYLKAVEGKKLPTNHKKMIGMRSEL